MHIAVPAETNPGELRVSITPDSVARLVKAGHAVRVQRGAGTRAGFPDTAYESAGATLADNAALYEGAQLVCRVQPPSGEEIVAMPRGAAMLSLLQPGRNTALLDVLAKHGITALALELVPRITRAQSMDVLSSQSTVAGYKAVLIGASALPQVPPDAHDGGRQHLAGEGVRHRRRRRRAAGDRHRASARRCRVRVRRPSRRARAGAVASARRSSRTSSWRRARRRRAATRARRARTKRRARVAAIANHIKDMDLVVTTAQIPGKPGAASSSPPTWWRACGPAP